MCSVCRLGVCPWEVFCHTEVFKNQEQSRKTSEVGTLIKVRSGRLCNWWWLPPGDGRQHHPGGGSTDIQVPLLSAALIQLIPVSCSALQAFGVCDLSF